jgi:hypothetical protein
VLDYPAPVRTCMTASTDTRRGALLQSTALPRGYPRTADFWSCSRPIRDLYRVLVLTLYYSLARRVESAGLFPANVRDRQPLRSRSLSDRDGASSA